MLLNTHFKIHRTCPQQSIIWSKESILLEFRNPDSTFQGMILAAVLRIDTERARENRGGPIRSK